MEFVRLHDRDQIEAYLRLQPDTHVYSLGDLEDDFWPHTSWFGATEGSEIKAICLVFWLYDPPIVIAISEPENEAMPLLLASIAGELPDNAAIHLGPEALGVLDGAFKVSPLVPHWKMALKNPARLEAADTSRVRQLNHDDVPRIEALFDAVYRGAEVRNIFYPSMLDIGPYFGVEESGSIVSTAGVHVYSTRYGVAAIANVATHPDARGRRLATAVVARLASELALRCDHIGLNVAQTNAPAIRAYRNAGFEIVAEFHEGTITRRPRTRSAS
jgi:ribosomal protein S18 acetylase RimI-like enzyme